MVLTAGIRAHAAGNDWMATLPDATRLSAITLPGTHNAGARFEPIAGAAQCQTATIAAQLGFGIRLLDVRCRHLNNAFQPGAFGIPNIRVVSNAINPQLADYFRRAKPGFYGWVIMDFATAELAEFVYRQNGPGAVAK